MPKAVLKSKVINYWEHDGTQTCANELVWQIHQFYPDATVKIEPDFTLVAVEPRYGGLIFIVKPGCILYSTDKRSLSVKYKDSFHNYYRVIDD